MPGSATRPDLQEFSRWLATKAGASATSTGTSQRLLRAARAARDEAICIATAAGNLSQLALGHRSVEVLQLLAAATADDSARPPELTTARGFKVTLAYDDGATQDKASICALVVSPPELIKKCRVRPLFSGTAPSVSSWERSTQKERRSARCPLGSRSLYPT
jgi:hypothetical protein